MQFLYYRPVHNRKVTLDDVKRWGLEYAFDVPPVCAQVAHRTPDGNDGRVFLRSNKDGEAPQINIDKQTWRKLPGERMGEAVWVGMWNEAKPGPRELFKTSGLPGYEYELLDGNTWVIPLVRQYIGDAHECALPRLMDFDEDGNAKDGEVIAKYRHLWELTKPIVDDLLASYELGPEQSEPLTKQQAASTAMELLATNYRVSIAEMTLLEAIANDSTVSGLCAIACDWPELVRRLNAQSEDEDAKKNDSADDGVSMSSGDAA